MRGHSSIVNRQSSLERGFTLMEMLVALSLAGLLMGGLIMTFVGALPGKSVEAAAEEFAAALRAAQNRALATKAPHAVYFTQTEYKVAQFVKYDDPFAPDPPGPRVVPMPLSTVGTILGVDAVRNSDVRNPGGIDPSFNSIIGFEPIKWMTGGGSFKRAKVIGAFYLNGAPMGFYGSPPNVVTIGGTVSLNYDSAVGSGSVPHFLISGEGQIVWSGYPGQPWSLEGDSSPSFVTFAAVRDLSKQQTVVVFQGKVTIKPGSIGNIAEYAAKLVPVQAVPESLAQ